MIELVRVTKRYGPVTVLDEVSLNIDKGESTAILGPSGCGKTTILRIIAGLEPIQSGEVRLRGASADRLAPHARAVSMMFQSPALWPHLTVRQNVELAATGSKGRIMDLLESLSIGDIGDRYPHQISGGQARRASLARTLAAQADIVLMDEPFAHLGETLAKQASLVALSWLSRSQATLIVAGHDLSLAHLLKVRTVINNKEAETLRGALSAQRGVCYG